MSRSGEFSRRMRGAYNAHAPVFAAASFPGMHPDLDVWARKLIGEVRPNGVIADVGCGPGIHASWFRQHGLRVLGIDLSDEMLHMARTSDSWLVQADMLSLPLASRRIDAVWCRASLLHVPRAAAASVVAALHDGLVSGGRMYVGLQEGTFEGWETTRQGVERYFVRYTEAEARAMLEPHFEVIEFARTDGPPRTWLGFLASARV